MATKLALTLHRIDLFRIVSLEVMGNNIGFDYGTHEQGKYEEGRVLHRGGF